MERPRPASSPGSVLSHAEAVGFEQGCVADDIGEKRGEEIEQMSERNSDRVHPKLSCATLDRTSGH